MISIRGAEVREGICEDWSDALELAWRTFVEFDAPDFTAEGREKFREFLQDDQLYKMFLNGNYRLFVATLYGKLVGMLTLREQTHISLLFVDGNCQRNGIGRALIEIAAETVARENRGESLSVFASPYALQFYRSLGFNGTDKERSQDGIRFTPMKLMLC